MRLDPADTSPEPAGVLQPKEPPDHWRKSPPLQVARPNPFITVPKRLVVEALVAKKLVEVA